MPRSGSPHSPQPGLGGGGRRQAGFHPVNYSVANSAPQIGGRRESESEPSHSEEENSAHRAGTETRVLSGTKGPAGGQAVRRGAWPPPQGLPGLQISAPRSLPTRRPGIPAGRPREDGTGMRERGRQAMHGWQPTASRKALPVSHPRCPRGCPGAAELPSGRAPPPGPGHRRGTALHEAPGSTEVLLQRWLPPRAGLLERRCWVL